MDLWDKVFEITKDVGTQIKDSANEILETQRKYQNMESDKLLRIIHNGDFSEISHKKRIIISNILQARNRKERMECYGIVSTKSELESALEREVDRIIVTNADLVI